MLHLSRRGRHGIAALGLMLLICCLGAAIPGNARAQSSILRSVIGAGGMASGTTTSVRSVLGQATAGSSTGSVNIIYVGFWSPGMPVSTGVPDEALPLLHRLYQNVPNPFNPRTTIAFDLPQPGMVRLRVYDVAGRLVRTLIDGDQAAGSQKVLWTGRDDRGHSVGSGIYLYVLETPQKRDSKKMTLIR